MVIANGFSQISNHFYIATHNLSAEPLMPNVISLGVEGNTIAGTGISQSLEYSWLMKGKENSIKPALVYSVGPGGGYDISAQAFIKVSFISFSDKPLSRQDIFTSDLFKNFGIPDYNLKVGALGVSFGVEIEFIKSENGGGFIHSYYLFLGPTGWGNGSFSTQQSQILKDYYKHVDK